MDVWNDLLPLRLHPDMGPELVTFGVLWELAGGRMRRLDVTTKMLAEHFARDGHSFRDHLEKLFALGVVHLIARDKRRGRFLINVLHPEFRLVRRKADPEQLRLPLAWTEGVRDMDDFLCTHPEDLTTGASVATIPSGDLATSREQSPAERSKSNDTGEAQTRFYPEPQTARSDDARMAFGRGVFPEPSAGETSRGQPTREENPALAANAREISHGDFPAQIPLTGISPRGFPRDANLTTETTSVTGKSPSPPAAGAREISHGDFPVTAALYTSRACAPARPPARPSLNDSSKEESLLNVLMNNESKCIQCSTFNEGSTVGARAERRVAAVDPETARLARLIDDRRAMLNGSRQDEPPPIAADVTAAVNAVGKRFAPLEMKQRLEAELRFLINDPKTGQWLCGFAADLMLVHGQSDRPEASKIYGAMAALLQEFRDLREVQRRNGQKPYPLGARLNKVVHAICDAHGIATPYKKRLARTAAHE
jgi:hypothetical protein